MRWGLIFWLGIIVLPAFSQNFEPVVFSQPSQEIRLSQIDLVSFDTRDQLYASTISGDIYLFDVQGKQLNFFSPPRQARLQQLEASWTVNIFCFSADLQEYRILDRFLNPLAERTLNSESITLPKAATLGNNNVIWVWDESDLSLKSLNFLQNQVIQTQPLNLILATEDLRITEIREFKNRLFMNAPESGIFIFDNQGNFLQKVAHLVDQRLCFYQENLFWVDGKKLMRYSLSQQVVEEVGDLPTEEILSVQFGQENLAFVKKEGVAIYPIPERLRKLP